MATVIERPRSNPAHLPCPPRRARARRGAVLVYTTVSITALIGIALLAVDWGHVQLVRTELQRNADATAHGYLAIYQAYGQSTANYYGPYLAQAANNPVDANAGKNPTVTTTWGYWNPATRQFYPGTNSGYPLAIQCVAARTAANGNPVPLAWGQILGRPTQDITCTSVAILTGSSSTNVSVAATSDPYLAGMPAGSTASSTDTTANASPLAASAVPIAPGTFLSFTGVSGTLRHGPAQPDTGPDGYSDPSRIWSHGVGASPPVPPTENGIGDAIMPGCALVGIFLDDNAPNTTPAPATRDYSTAIARDRASYDDIQLKQPFFVGDGRTSGGTTQQFRVPPGATRLYLAVWDGYDFNNNVGSIAATLRVSQSIQLVR